MIKPWSVEDDNTLRAMKAEGKSYSLIAEVLGRTRDSCIGHGWRSRDAALRGQPVISRDRKPSWFIRPRQPRRPRIIQKFVVKQFHAFTPVPDAPNWLGLSMMELTNKTCRFPSHERPFFYCGDPTANLREGLSYCAYHYNMTHRFPDIYSNPYRFKKIRVWTGIKGSSALVEQEFDEGSNNGRQ